MKYLVLAQIDYETEVIGVEFIKPYIDMGTWHAKTGFEAIAKAVKALNEDYNDNVDIEGTPPDFDNAEFKVYKIESECICQTITDLGINQLKK